MTEEIGAAEPSAEVELARQARRFIELGFHRELGLSEQEYLASIPGLASQPSKFKGRFDTLVLVDPRISSQRQAELAGVKIEVDKLENWPEKKLLKTLDKPYIVWMQEGKKTLNKTFEKVKLAMADDENPASFLEGIALYITKPDILKDHNLVLPGTSCDTYSVVALVSKDGEVVLTSYSVVFMDPKFGFLTWGELKEPNQNPKWKMFWKKGVEVIIA